MKTKLFQAAMALALSSIGFAEPTEAPPIDLAARKASVVNLESHIYQREKRLAELGQDIVTLDARIEKRVDELVKMLASMSDSKDSRTRVANIKQDAIDGLKRGIDLYVAKRKEVRERVRTGDETALGDLGKFDDRVIKRVDQIVELTKSFPSHRDVEKYESDGGSYWRGYYNENTRISDDWRQNRRDTTKANQQRDETAKAIRDGIARLDQRRRSMKDLLANRELSESARKLYMQELGQIDAQTERLNSELLDVTTSAGGGATRQPGLDEAHDIEQLFEDARKDLRGDVSNLFRLYDEFAIGRVRLADLKENLAARKAWLEKNAPAGK
jgi:predicted  nucleic acid-binding Zn-ribbon protein